jgi:anti-sigma factor RsiW
MRCAKVGLLVDRYVDRKLPPDLTEAVAAHEKGCARCARRVAAARRLAGFLAAERPVRAPAGFHEKVMDAVYREALKGSPAERQPSAERATAAGSPSSRLRTYRRLGLSFMLSAVVLTVSLVLPQGLYPSLFRPESVAAGLSRGAPSAVKDALDGAGRAVQGTLHKGGISR